MMSSTLSNRARYALLSAAIGGRLFDGFELGLLPVASLSVSEALPGAADPPTLECVFAAGLLFAALGGSYPKVGAICGLIYLLGAFVIWWAPDTGRKSLDE